MTDQIQAPIHSQRAHGLISASKFERVETCPGSVTLFGGIPERESVYAAEGTAAHEALDHFLHTGEWPDDISDSQRMVLEHVVDWLKRYSEGGTLYSEVSLSHPLASWATGTTDVVIQWPNWLVIFDLKYGAGVDVDAVENKQLAFYANLVDPHGFYDGNTLFVICQPRMGWFKSWRPPQGWQAQFRQSLVHTIHRVTSGDTTLAESDKGCRWCPGLLVCPIKTGRIRKFALMSVMNQNVAGLTDDELAKLYEEALVAKAMISKVEAEAKARVQIGKLPGFVMAQGQGRRAWAYDEQVVIAALTAKGKDPAIFYDQTLVSPAEAESRLGPEGKRIVAPLVNRGPAQSFSIERVGTSKPLIDPHAAEAALLSSFGVS